MTERQRLGRREERKKEQKEGKGKHEGTRELCKCIKVTITTKIQKHSFLNTTMYIFLREKENARETNKIDQRKIYINNTHTQMTL